MSKMRVIDRFRSLGSSGPTYLVADGFTVLSATYVELDGWITVSLEYQKSNKKQHRITATRRAYD